VQFHPEQIELLWLIPVIALVVFIFIIQLVGQKREQTGMSQDVARFNNGSIPFSQQMSGGADRLNQLERAISTITDSLTVQQQALTQVSKGSASYSGEISDLKAKLRELYKEYDIVLSENYSLRAKVKKLEETDPPQARPQNSPISTHNRPSADSYKNDDVHFSSKVDMKLYEDTRSLSVSLLEDTSEFDINDFSKRPKS